MKNGFPLFLIFFLFTACSTTKVAVPVVEDHEKILEVPGVTKVELYARANAWFVETFNSSESVIEFQDKGIGKIMGKYTWNIKDSFGNIFSYRNVISVEVKEGRARIKFYDPSTVKKGYWTLISTLKPASYNYQMNTFFLPKWEKMGRSLEERLKESDDW